MFPWQPKEKDPVINIRQWNSGDIPHIMRLVSQYPTSGWNYEHDEWRKWIMDSCYYGIVIEENYAIRGCAIAFVSKNPRVYIDLFQVDMKYQRQGYGTLMMYHLFSKICAEKNKTLCFNVKDTDKDMQLFLASPKIGFVPMYIHEFYDEYDEKDSAIYVMEYPPPWGYRKGTIRILKNGKETTKHFPQTPDPA